MSETSIGADMTVVNADRVAGDRVAGDDTEWPAPAERDIHVMATYGGGDPTMCRIREVSITIPVLGVNDYINEYEHVISTVLTELGKLGTIKNFESSVVAP